MVEGLAFPSVFQEPVDEDSARVDAEMLMVRMNRCYSSGYCKRNPFGRCSTGVPRFGGGSPKACPRRGRNRGLNGQPGR